MNTGLPVFDRTLQETNLWLEDLETRLGASRHEAYAALRATLHVMRDHLPAEVAMHFAAQLPMLLRGMFTEGWRLAPKTKAERSLDAFLAEIGERLTADFTFDPETIARAAFQTVRSRVDIGLADKVMDCLPGAVRELWLEDVL